MNDHEHDDATFRPTEPPELTEAATARMLDTVRAGTTGAGGAGGSVHRPWVVVLAAAAAAVVVVGGAVGVARLVQDGPPPVAAPAPTTTASPLPTTVAPTTTVPPTTTATTTTEAPPTTTTTTAAPAATTDPSDLGGPAPFFPPELTGFALNGNEELWAVYVAVSPFGDPSIATERAALSALGYTGSGGTLGCDYGAAEALGADPTDSTAVVYFSTRTRASQFVAAWDRPVVGTAQVTIGCNDGAGG